MPASCRNLKYVIYKLQWADHFEMFNHPASGLLLFIHRHLYSEAVQAT